MKYKNIAHNSWKPPLVQSYTAIGLYKSTELHSIASMWLLISKSIYWKDVAEDNTA